MEPKPSPRDLPKNSPRDTVAGSVGVNLASNHGTVPSWFSPASSLLSSDGVPDGNAVFVSATAKDPRESLVDIGSNEKCAGLESTDFTHAQSALKREKDGKNLSLLFHKIASGPNAPKDKEKASMFWLILDRVTFSLTF